jgi:hypothetical protein
MDAKVPKAEGQDPFDGERWSVAVAAAWIIWRSREYVGHLLSDLNQSEGGVQVFDIFNEASRRENVRGGPPKGGVLPFLEAQAELWKQLKQGRLLAIGVKAGEATWSQIAPEAWGELDHYYCGSGQSDAIGSLGLVKYFNVTVPRSEVLAPWPLPQYANTQSKRGRKPNIPQKEIDIVVFKLLDYHGDLSDDDPKWCKQSQLEAETRKALSEKFKGAKIPLESTLRVYVSKSLRQGREQKGR